ncbi:hypothetical protein AB0I72_27415 [Nocardiopsis sp. NPDC049922]|uniref:hypothetical protein n=1 Tax=Nocardiopsis sp. NPDC049922 TaxID=3155157 RepID=UPI00340E2126
MPENEALTLDHNDGYLTHYVSSDGRYVHDSLMYVGELGGDKELEWRKNRIREMMGMFPEIVYAYILGRAIDAEGGEKSVMMRTYNRAYFKS